MRARASGSASVCMSASASDTVCERDVVRGRVSFGLVRACLTLMFCIVLLCMCVCMRGCVQALMYVTEQHCSKEHAELMNKYIVKVCVKVAVLYQQKLVTPENMDTLRVSFRRLCASVCNAFRIDTYVASVKRISQLYHKLCQDIITIVQPHVSQKHIQYITDTLHYFGSEEFLLYAFQHQKQQLKQVVFVFLHYLEVTQE